MRAPPPSDASVRAGGDRAPLSVVHVLAPAPFGGLETVVTTLAHGQAAAGERVVVAAVVEPGHARHPFLEESRAAGVPCRALTVAARAYLAERRAVRALLREVRADVLHTHGFRPDVVDGPAARRLDIPTVTTVHGFTGKDLRGRLYEWLQRRAFRRFDAVVAVSDALRDDLIASRVPPDRVHVLRNAWAPSAPPADRARARSELGIPGEETVVGWVGRLSAEKGPEVMVRALARCSDARVKVSMVGSGPMDPELRALAAELGVADRIRWHGVVRGAASLLTAFDAVFLTSWTEGTPMTLLEAMAAEVPVVSTSVGGVPDIVSQAEATLVGPGDEVALGAAMLEIASGAPGVRERAVAAHRRLVADFAVAPWVERYRALYSSCLRA